MFGGESAADSAQMALDYGRLFGKDLVASSLHPIELFDFFSTLRKNKWEGVWQLDHLPFRELATCAIESLRLPGEALVHRISALSRRPRASGAPRIAHKALFGAF